MNALLGLIAHNNGGRVELDLRKLREVVGRPLAMHFDLHSDTAIVELLPEELKAPTCKGPTKRQ